MKLRIPISLLLLSLFTGSSLAAPHPAGSTPSAAALQAIAKSALEESSPARQHALEDFAGHYQDQLAGTLARIALGYSAYQAKQYSEAAKHFEAAHQKPSLVQDYAEYYQALSEAALGNHEAAAKQLAGFAGRYPKSTLAPQAALELATSLAALKRLADAAAVLESTSITLPQPDAAFLLAETYERIPRLMDAVAAYRSVYYDYPADPRAATAERRLTALQQKMGAAYPGATVEMRRTRAEKLYAAGRWRDARTAYETLASVASGSLLDQARVRAAACLYHLSSTWPALTALQKLEVSDPEADAERLYTMAAAYRRLGRAESMEQQLDLLKQKHPQSEWREKALLVAGNHYLLQKSYTRAGDFYRLSFEEFPEGETAAAGHWKVAWQAYRERRWQDARHLLEEHVLNFPSSPQISAALYWTARVIERESPPAAVAYYQKVNEAFPNYYYAMLARERLQSLPQPQSVAKTVDLGHIQRRIVTQEVSPASEQPYRERARLLESAWLLDWSFGELRAVLAKDPSAWWAGSEMARLEKERGRHHLALRYAKRYVPSYFAQDLPALSRDVWELLFPRPYWEHLKKQAAAAKVDPYLMAGLIRQESEFYPQARSRSNARGLMQLLPSTARYMSRLIPDPRVKPYRLASLSQPEINLVYGTYYFKKVLDQFGGTVEYALAGYNAGETRVEEWLRDGPFEDTAEFVENIPFTETREYVQAVLRNAAVYRALYSTDGTQASTGTHR